MSSITNTDNIIDSRDVIARIEELEADATPCYVAGYNMSGYMPDNEPTDYDDLDDAKEDLATTLESWADDMEETAESLDGEERDDYNARAEDYRKAARYFRKTEEEEPAVIVNQWAFWIKQEGTRLDQEDQEELDALKALADQCEGYGDWDHGETLIHEDYFVEYCQELVQDIGDLPRDLPGYLVIDWEATADNLEADYTRVDFDGQTYLMRS